MNGLGYATDWPRRERYLVETLSEGFFCLSLIVTAAVLWQPDVQANMKQLATEENQ